MGLIPTQSMMYLDLPGHENPWKEPIAAILDPKDINFPANPATGERDPGGRPPRPEAAKRFLELDTHYRKAGAKYLAGSGADAFGTLPGISLHTELALLTRIGLTPRQALAAATGNVSELLGWSEVGQLKAGSNADLLVLDADPTQDISHLKKIRMVLLNGEILDRERLLHPPAAPENPPAPSLYERIAERLARDPDLAQRLKSPPPQLAEMSWMLGSWDITARVFATASTPERVSQGQSDVRFTLGNRWLLITDTYPDGGMDEGYLT
ncbi:MAG: amidohydrolase family protein, partial [Acidobacteriota bacterium]